MMSAFQDLYINDSAFVENAGPSITTKVPPSCTVADVFDAALYTSWLREGQNGSANAMWATTSLLKNVVSLMKVLSIS